MTKYSVQKRGKKTRRGLTVSYAKWYRPEVILSSQVSSQSNTFFTDIISKRGDSRRVPTGAGGAITVCYKSSAKAKRVCRLQGNIVSKRSLDHYCCCCCLRQRTRHGFKHREKEMESSKEEFILVDRVDTKYEIFQSKGRQTDKKDDIASSSSSSSISSGSGGSSSESIPFEIT
ncbi:hypothetical protein M0802_002306 [Mischocyttarus mexicanus]|nr:hypothetical protein M0802_002306 [Mischocyttarus mexicanus]